MRSFSMLFWLALLLLAVISGVHTAPTGEEAMDKREFPVPLGKRMPPKPLASTVPLFIKYLEGKPAILKKAPVFWTGKSNQKPTFTAAKVLKNNQNIVGTHGGITVLDALKDAKLSYEKWELQDWHAGCRAFAEHVQPEEKKAFLVYGEEVIKPDSVWIVSEKPALDSNDKVKEVMGYQMAVDGKTLTPKGDIKGKKI
ncbi:hypothetical protein BT96DRAFT_977434 [Gymnopus androsaceus JB14]|uniref:Uncharacterized protein n=1 Tax=Gymnopus androsaceus JB14 TaxID=1447944 RepID=A0A6A4HDQ1_9AGAR|nr:hypothetical protein BT96DRAFT_977434 [Gymnopus androsaceus JB14]